MNRTQPIEFVAPTRSHEKLKRMIEARALCLKGRDHFVNSQGVQSNFLFDFRPLLMDPLFLNFVVDVFWKHYRSYSKIQIITLELGSLTLLGAILAKAKELNIEASGVFVRKSRKKTGRQRVIEGELTGAPIIAIDDLINSGTSINKIILALKDEGRSLSECFAILTFNDPRLKKFLKKNKLKATFLFSLSDFGLKKDSSVTTRYNVFANFFEFRPFEGLHKAISVGPRSNVTLDPDLGQLYYGTSSGKVYCIDANSGEFIWDFMMKSPHPKGVQSTPILSNGKIYFGGYDGNIYSLDAKTGACLWMSGEADYIHSTPVIDEDLGLIFIGLELNHPTYKGAIAAYSINSGQIIWNYRVKEYVPCSPSYSKKLNLIAIGTNDTFLLMLNARTGEKVWSFPTGGAIKATPVFYDDDKFVIAASHDGNVYGLAAESGKLLWFFRTDSAIYATPLVYNNIVVFGSTDRNIYILDLYARESVAVIPTFGRIFSAATLINDRILLGNNNGQVFEINPQTFTIESEHQLPDRVCSTITFNERNKLLYVHASDDRVFAFRKFKILEPTTKTKRIARVPDKNALKRSANTMSRFYTDGSVGINTTLKVTSYFKVDGLKALVWRFIDGYNSEITITKKLLRETNLPRAEVYERLAETLNEFLRSELIEPFDV